MIYEFSHYATPDGRRVRFVVAREDVEAIRARGHLAAEWAREVDVRPIGAGHDVTLVMTPAAARLVVDCLAMVGGDAVVAARLLANALDGMVHELRAVRVWPTRVRVLPSEPRECRCLRAAG